VPFELEEATIKSLQDSMATGKHTARSLTELYLKRIDDTNHKGPKLGAVIETNPDAVQIADQLDAERRTKGARGPLHGVPMLIKEKIDTADRMLTTAGSPALGDSRPSRDAFVVERLRHAGAVILGKTNLIELAGFKGVPQFSWSTRGGLCRNPYALDRSAIGSSSGSAAGVSANLTVAGIGSETHGSIMGPSAFCGVVAVKPTVGLVSRAGIVPIVQSFDTAGPIARTVTDAALVLAAIAGIDPHDPATAVGHTFNAGPALSADDLRGARIGVAKAFFGDDARVVRILERTVDVMKQRGAEIITIPDAELSPQRLLPTFDRWFMVMTSEFKDGLNRYLLDRGPQAAVKSMQDLIDFNERTQRPLRLVNQQLLAASQAAGSLSGDPYRTAIEAVRKATRDDGLDAVIQGHTLDCVIAPTVRFPLPCPIRSTATRCRVRRFCFRTRTWLGIRSSHYQSDWCSACPSG
jgi:amidase